MNSIQKLNELMKATLVLAETPLLKLQENKNLLKDLKRIVSTQNFDSIMNSLRNERLQEDNFINPVGNQDSNSIEFTKKFVNFQNVNYDLFSKNKNTESFFSMLPVAKNSKIKKSEIQEVFNAVQKTKEAKEFQEIFNSVYSDKALQIGTSQDPTFIQSYVDYSPYIYNYQAYLAIPTLSQTVDRPIEIALKKTPIIDFKDDVLDAYFQKYLKIENIIPKLKKFILYSTLSPRGSLVAPILDKSGKIKIQVFNDTQFTYSVMPQYSRFDTNDNE